jgi:hypothetical protein
MVGRRTPENWTCLPQQQHGAILVSWQEKACATAKEKFSRRQVYISHFSRRRGVHYCDSARDSLAVIIRHGAALRPCSTGCHRAAASSSGDDIGGTTSSAGGALGGPPPSSTGGGNRATSSSMSSCNKALGAPSTKKQHLD